MSPSVLVGCWESSEKGGREHGFRMVVGKKRRCTYLTHLLLDVNLFGLKLTIIFNLG